MTPKLDAGAQVPDFIPTINMDGGFVFVTCKQNHRLSISTTIERLIDMLDAMEPDPDLEPYLGSGDDREGGDAGEADLEPWLGWNDHEAGRGQYSNTQECGLDREDDRSDCEPCLGAPETRFAGGDYFAAQRTLCYSVAPLGSQEAWAAGARDDREDDGDDREPDNDEERMNGWVNEGSQAVLNDCEGEPDLGWTEVTDQTKAGLVQDGVWMGQDGEPDLGFVGHGTGWREGEGTDDREQTTGADDDRERDDAERGIADDDALNSAEFMLDGWTGDGSGHQVAEGLLRERARRLPSGDIVRRITADRDAVSVRKRERRGKQRRPVQMSPDLSGYILVGNITELKASDFDRLPWA